MITRHFIKHINCGVPYNEIWYISTDGDSIMPLATDAFGANIVDNSYENGKGVITFDGKVTKIGYTAFEDCRSLTSITIPNSVMSIDVAAFGYCSSLTSINIPNSVTSIGDHALEYCSSLTSVTIGESVTSIGYGAFEDCSSLTSITYEGTKEQWNAVTKGEYWNENVPAAYVQCTDGTITL